VRKALCSLIPVVERLGTAQFSVVLLNNQAILTTNH